MSNLDVQVLKSFTRKLAAMSEAELDARIANGRRPFQDDPPTSSGAAPSNFGPTSATMGASISPDPVFNPRLSDSAGDERPTPNTMRSNPSGGLPPVSGNTSLALDKNMGKPGAPDSAAVTTSSNPFASPDLSASSVPGQQNSYMDMLMGALPYAGGAAAGGLGAMALARLFNSSKDDEEESSWAPWLTGLAGAGLGAGAVHYSPQIMEMVNALRGGDTAPAAVSAPAAQA